MATYILKYRNDSIKWKLIGRKMTSQVQADSRSMMINEIKAIVNTFFFSDFETM